MGWSGDRPTGYQGDSFHNVSPNEGIWRSGKNGLVAGPIGGFILGLAVGPVRGLVAALIGGLLFWLVAGLVLGLETFVRHFILRFILSWRGDLPWNLVPFLDEAVERLLLRKVGGSYVFVHRQLLDYFTTLDEPASTFSTSKSSKV